MLICACLIMAKVNATTKGRKSYTIQKKSEVLMRFAALEGNISKTVKECGVPRSCMQDWIKGQEHIEMMKDKQVSSRKRRKASAVAGSNEAKRRA